MHNNDYRYAAFKMVVSKSGSPGLVPKTPALHICPTYFHNQNITDSSASQNILEFYQQLTGEERSIPFIFASKSKFSALGVLR
jgi:hypothetical protein